MEKELLINLEKLHTTKLGNDLYFFLCAVIIVKLHALTVIMHHLT